MFSALDDPNLAEKLGSDAAQHFLDARGFLVGQPRRPNGRDHVVQGGVAHGLPRGEAGLQREKAFVPVGVRRALAQDGADQFVQRWQMRPPFRLTIHLSQQVSNWLIFGLAAV